MILVDSSIWIDHLRRHQQLLHAQLIEDQVLSHPFIVGELAMGGLGNGQDFFSFLQDLPKASVAHDDEVLTFISRHRLVGTGIGYIDAHLLASAQLTRVAFWTRDRRLQEIATKLSLAFIP